MDSEKNGRTARLPVPEEQQLIERCEVLAKRLGLAFKVVPMPFPEARLGLRLANNGVLDPVVARLRVLKKGPMVRAYSQLPSNRAEVFGKCEVRVEGRMKSQTVWTWPVDEGKVERYLSACAKWSGRKAS